MRRQDLYSADGGRCATLLRAALLAAMVAVPAAAQMVPGDTEIEPAWGDQSKPAIARGDGMLLAVWADARANTAGAFFEGETVRDIYGMRIALDGSVLDAVPIAIAAGKSAQDNPKVAWNGAHWLVVFESWDLNGTGYYYERSLEAVRVGPSGHVLDDRPIKLYGLTPSGGPSPYWAMASDGNNWVVVNQGSSTTSGVLAMRISPDGLVLDPPNRILVDATYFLRSNFHLAYAAGVFLMTYDDNGYTDAVRFDSGLNLLGGIVTLLPSPITDLAPNDSGFYMVWNRQEPDFSTVVAGTRVNTQGQPLDGNGINISGSVEPYEYAKTAVAWDGLSWCVTWGQVDDTAWAARVSAAGQLANPGSLLTEGVLAGPTAGNGQGGVQLVFEEYANTNSDIYTAAVDSNQTAGAVQPLSVGAPRQMRSDAAAGGSGYMMVYSSTTANALRVLAQPLDAAGGPLTAEPIELDAGPLNNGPTHAHVAWNGSCYLAAWGSASGVVGQRLLPDGSKLDPAPVLIMSAASKAFGPADVAALNGDFLVVGRKIGINPQYIFPAAARVRGADGVVLDAEPLVLGGSFVGRIPAVVSLGSRWLAVWHQNNTHDNPIATTRGAFVNADGTFLPPFAIYGPFSTSGGNSIFELGLASSGDLAMLVQSDELSSGVETDVLARLIQANGTVQPMINLTPWTGNQFRPRAAWDGEQFVVVYQDQKNRLAEWSLNQLDARSDLFGMRVLPTGAVLDPQGFAFSALPSGESDPNVTGSAGQVLISGSILRDGDGHRNYRVIYEQRGQDGNAWPVAVAQASPAAGDVPMTVEFGSTGSNDPDGSIVSYLWDFGDGTTSTQANPSHTYIQPGPHVASLTLVDDDGASTTQTVLVKAVAPNQVPVAVASANIYAGVLPLDVELYSAGSYDPDGFIGNVEWLFSDGGSYWGATAYHTFTQPGPQTVTLRVHDARGGVGTTSLVINAEGVNLPPVAAASAVPSTGYSPLTVQFSSGGSYDADGTIVAYQWAFGDGSEVSNEASAVHVYASSGTYYATLTVWDNENAPQSDTVQINVAARHHVEYGMNLSLGAQYIEEYEQGEEPSGPIEREAVIAGYGRVAGKANVGFGTNRARVDLAGTNPGNPLYFEYGFATSRYWDVFQFDDPELNGTVGSFETTLYVAGSGHVDLSDGYLQAPTEFDAFWHAVVNVTVEGVTNADGSPVQSAFYAGEWYKGSEMNTLEYFGDPLNTYQQTVTFNFIYGQPIFMDSFLQVNTDFDNQMTSAAGTMDTVIDLGNSSYWGGIRNLRDAQGNLVTTAQYSSSSGFDYRQSALEARLFLTPAGEQASATPVGPTSLVMNAGETATVEVWIAHTGERELGAFQIALPGAAFPASGAEGSVSYVDTPGAGGSAFIDTGRPEWVFAADGTVNPAYAESGLPGGFAMMATLPTGNGALISDMAYLGEFQIQASPDARGLFTLGFLPLGAPPDGGTSLLDEAQVAQLAANQQPLHITVLFAGDCADNAADCADAEADGIRDDACVWWACQDQECAGTDIAFADMGGSFGACEPDGFVNLFDRNQALLCFSGQTPCDSVNLDAGGAFGSCQPDGFCNLFDANHAVTAFAGANPCTCPATPAPQAAVETAGAAGMRLATEQKKIRPGELVRVRVLLDSPLTALQSYQLHVASSGGSAGALQLVDIAVASGKQAAFSANEPFTAFNIGRGQMLAGLEKSGVPVPAGAVLAILTYQASADAAGEFVIDVLGDESAQDQTFLVSDFTKRIEITSVAPALISVQRDAMRKGR